MEKDTTKLWRLTKLLNEDNTEKRQTAIESQNEHLTQKRAANCFAHMYQEECPEKEQCMSETKYKKTALRKTCLLTDA